MCLKEILHNHPDWEVPGFFEAKSQWHPTVMQEYAMALGYSPFISLPNLCYVSGPDMPSYDEWLAHVEETVAEYRKKDQQPTE